SDVHFLPIACGQTYCGTSGTYRTNKNCSDYPCDMGDSCIGSTCRGPDDNTKDYDFYRIQVSLPTRITWTVNAAFPVIIQVLESPDDHCTTAVSLATAVNPAQCAAAIAAADVCPGYIYLSVAP